MGAIHGAVRRLTELSAGDKAKWRALADRAIDENPFFDPDYVEPLAAGLGTGAEVHLAVVEDGEDWLACMPVHPTNSWHRVRLPAVATWRGHVLYGLLGTPLLAPDPSEETLAAFLGTLHSVRPRATYLALDWLAADSPATATLVDHLGGDPRRADASRALEFERFERAVVHRRPENNYVEETLSPKHRRELRRQWRKLGERVGEEPRMIDISADPAAPRLMVDVEAAASKAARGTMLAHDAGHTEFFLSMCRRFAARGALEIFALRAGEETIAIKCNLTTRKTLFGLKIAYAPRWSDYSPGIQLELQALKFFHECSEALMMDTCADANNAMANRLLPDRRQIVSYAVPADGAMGAISKPVLRAARAYRTRRSR